MQQPIIIEVCFWMLGDLWNIRVAVNIAEGLWLASLEYMIFGSVKYGRFNGLKSEPGLRVSHFDDKTPIYPNIISKFGNICKEWFYMPLNRVIIVMRFWLLHKMAPKHGILYITFCSGHLVCASRRADRVGWSQNSVEQRLFR